MFSKALPEDCVKYYLLFSESVLPKSAHRRVLEEVRQAIEHLKNSLLGNYLWQCEGLNVAVVEIDGHEALCGETRFRDSIDDEWVVTFILRELSLKFPKLWVRLEDTDGEFLLIEAAKALPRWLNPDVATNRVWIKEGQLLIIPPGPSAKSHVGGLTLGQALGRLNTLPSQLLHLPRLEAEAFHRLQKYPQSLAKNNHRALVLIPRNLAYIIHQRPNYICPAVDAFYVRDPISTGSLHSSRKAKVTFGPLDLVETCVKFTRVGFAQLKTQHFPMSSQWAQMLPNDEIAKNFDRLELGMKVAYGFETLVTDPQYRNTHTVHDIVKLLLEVHDDIEHLPSNTEVSSWEKGEDDDSWLNIDYTDFERDLDSMSPSSSIEAKSSTANSAQEELQKLVSRFKTFVNQDDSSESDGGSSPGSEDGSLIMETNLVDGTEEAALGKSADEIGFSEARFLDMMRGLSSHPSNSCQERPSSVGSTQGLALVSNEKADAQDSDEDEVMLSSVMESELLELGALQSAEPNWGTAFPPCPLRTTGLLNSEHEVLQRDSHEEDELDYNLARNMLESFKSQAGLAGPGGNLMGLMGVRLPRDDGGSGQSDGFASTPTKETDEKHK